MTTLYQSASADGMSMSWHCEAFSLPALRKDVQFQCAVTCLDDLCRSCRIRNYEHTGLTAYGHCAILHFTVSRHSANGLCLVMEQANRDLVDALAHERIAGRNNTATILKIFTEIIQALQQIHKQGFAHCRIQPTSIMRVNETWRLAGLANCCRFGDSLSNRSLSTGYCPPEVARAVLDAGHGNYDEPSSVREDLDLTASPAYDLWGLGVVLYNLVSSFPLWRTDPDGNVAPGELQKLALWDEQARNLALFEAGLQDENKAALHDLLSKLLESDPQKRMSHWTRGSEVSSILSHPFFGNNAALPDLDYQRA
eukprot:scaffold213622_cov43-Prasinocladus_malaysianus.AAC.4